MVRVKIPVKILFLSICTVVVLFEMEKIMTNWQTFYNQSCTIETVRSKLCPNDNKVIPRNSVVVWSFIFDWTKNNICSDINYQTEPYRKVALKYPGGEIPIYIHDSRKDGISKNIEEKGEWEPHLDDIIQRYLTIDPSIIFNDIGANLGTVSLKAAKIGNKVIAIEAEKSNTNLLCKSVFENNLQSNINIIHNIVGKSHFRNLSMAVGQAGDRSSNFVLDSKELQMLKRKSDGQDFYKHLNDPVPLVTLDDLLTLPEVENNTGHRYFIKMDVEGYEDEVLKGGMSFFKRVKVIGILMEWRWHRVRNSANTIYRWMSRWGLKPFSENMKPLLSRNPRFWSDDVLWLPHK